MSFISNIFSLLEPTHKRSLKILLILLIIGVFFEMIGLGIMIPALTVMLQTDIGKEFPAIKPFLNFIGNPKQEVLIIMGMVMLVVVNLIKAVFLMYMTWRQSRFAAELSAYLSQRLFLGYMQLPYAFHLQRNSSELIRNIQAEVVLFIEVVKAAIILSTEVSVLLTTVIFLLIIEPTGALGVTCFLALGASVFYRIIKTKIANWGKQRQYHDGLATKHLFQGLGGVKDVKILGREEEFLEEYAKHNFDSSRILAKVLTIGQAPRLYLELLAVFGLAVLVIVMMLNQKRPDELIPVLGVFVVAAFRMIPSVNRIMGAIQTSRYSKSVVELLNKEFKIIQKNSVPQPAKKSIELFTTSLELHGLTFKYPGVEAMALNNISLQINKGETVGFIGPSGSGKSTLVDLILGLFHPTSGFVTVDGLDIHKNLRNWQNQIGYIPQSIYLTDDSLKRNVAFGIPENKIDDVIVMRAIKAAQLEKLVETLPDGLETIVGERGIRLSGGQRQRIGIARALYHDPAVLVLDEATSALDTETEAGVMDSVNFLHGSKTVLIIAHRLSTVQNCDKIYRIEQGVVVSEGKSDIVLQYSESKTNKLH